VKIVKKTGEGDRGRKGKRERNRKTQKREVASAGAKGESPKLTPARWGFVWPRVAGRAGRPGQARADRAGSQQIVHGRTPRARAPPRHHTGHTGAGASPGPESQLFF